MLLLELDYINERFIIECLRYFIQYTKVGLDMSINFLFINSYISYRTLDFVLFIYKYYIIPYIFPSYLIYVI